MASVTSLDKDLRKLRLDRFTPAAANEARVWIEETLGETLSSPDLLEALKDGVALCKLVNKGLPPPGLKFKLSAMPFVQMENISLFLQACQAPPFNLHQHDCFLTVDLFEQKDPTQVLQCLGAFSRAANAVDAATFPNVIGPRARTGGMSPQVNGPPSPVVLRNRGASITSNTSSAYGLPKPLLLHKTGDSASGRWSPSRSPTRSPTREQVKSPALGGSAGNPNRVSTWSRRDQESVTSPAWNIAQYGYMGGASQGNLGISFGGRRQITGADPQVPSLAEKERLRKEEEERQRQEAQEEALRRRAEAEAEEEQARRDEERKWEEETERLRDEERRKAEREQREWEEQERQWQQTEQQRRQEDKEAQARLEEERRRVRSRSSTKLRGQYLSQHQAEQDESDSTPSSRVRELEKELELARQREAAYERERERAQRPPRPVTVGSAEAVSRTAPPIKKSSGRVQTRVDSWAVNEREVLQSSRQRHRDDAGTMATRSDDAAQSDDVRPDDTRSDRAESSPTALARPPPDPIAAAGMKTRARSSTASSGRPLPDPTKYSSSPATTLTLPPPLQPLQQQPQSHLRSRQPDAASEDDEQQQQQRGDGRRRGLSHSQKNQNQNPQNQGKSSRPAAAAAAGAGAGTNTTAPKSLLEREMELERQRQREWEAAQQETAKAVRSGDGGGVDGRWDVGQWSGYTGGDGQNRGARGIGAGRRQIVGPRPLPGSKR